MLTSAVVSGLVDQMELCVCRVMEVGGVEGGCLLVSVEEGALVMGGLTFIFLRRSWAQRKLPAHLILSPEISVLKL